MEDETPTPQETPVSPSVSPPTSSSNTAPHAAEPVAVKLGPVPGAASPSPAVASPSPSPAVIQSPVIPPASQTPAPHSPAPPAHSPVPPHSPAPSHSPAPPHSPAAVGGPPAQNRPWTSRPASEETATLLAASRSPAETETARRKSAPPDEAAAVARWVSHLRREGGKTFEQGLVVQPAEDEAGRKFEDVFASRESDETPAEEFKCGASSVCHPLCHVRPMRGITRTNQISNDSPFCAAWYQEIASQRCNYADLPPAPRLHAATKLYHQINGDEISGEPGGGAGDVETACQMCRHHDPLVLAPFGQECCTHNWNRFHRLSKFTGRRPRVAGIPMADPTDLDKTTA